jgi:acyl-coenzyme A synthetase/AMP-(fatty) acid ligase
LIPNKVDLGQIEIFEKSVDYNTLRSDIRKNIKKYNDLNIVSGKMVLIITRKSYEQIITIYSFLELGVIGVIYSPDELQLLKLNDEYKTFDYILKDPDFILPEIFNSIIISEPDHELVKTSKKTQDHQNIIWGFFTSGTTGIRKLIGISDDNLNSRIESEKKLFDLSSSSRCLNFLNFSHELGFYNLLAGVSTGSSVFVRNILSAQHFYNTLVDLRISMFVGVPKLWSMLCKSELILKLKSLKSLKLCTISGGSLNFQLESDIFINLPDKCELVKTYGQTETSRSLVNKVKSIEDLKYLGKKLEGVSLKVSSSGELIHSGMGVMAGLYCFKEKIFKKVKEVNTGDVFKQNDDGTFLMIDRVDRIIKINDVRISLTEIESLLMSSMLLEEACCIFNKEILAFIVMKNEEEKDCFDLWLKLNTPKYIDLKKIYFLNNLPVNSAGKISYEKLRML